MLILPNVNMMDDAEIEAIREWVRRGGKLLATGWTSLVDTRGRLRKDFGLGDVFGVSLQDAELDGLAALHCAQGRRRGGLRRLQRDYPAFARTTGQEVSLAPGFGRAVLATTTLVWPAGDPTRFSSIHSNPPWKPTDRPEVVLNRFGEGKADLLRQPDRDDREPERTRSSGWSGGWTIGSAFEADAPAAVELTLFHQPERHRYRLSLVNFQKDLPNIPVTEIPVRLRLPGKVVQIVEFPGDRQVAHSEADGVVRFTVPRLETLAMFGVIVG